MDGDDSIVFERFTQKAIKVIILAQEESRRLGHNFVGTEMILLGIIGEGTNAVARLLKEKGVTLKAAREEVEKINGRGSGYVGPEILLSPRAKQALNHAQDIAKSLGYDCITVEHLFLGVEKESHPINVGMRVCYRLIGDFGSLAIPAKKPNSDCKNLSDIALKGLKEAS